MKLMVVAAVAAAVGLAAAAEPADSAFELAFRGGTLDAFETGDRLDYSSRVSSATEGQGQATTISVELDEEGVAALEERDGADEPFRRLASFDASVGNPLGMYFLERTIRSVAQATGGSVFYLRNRIKDALRAPEDVRDVRVDWRGRQVDATRILLAPFETDPNLDKLGSFGDLRISLIVGREIPGWYHTLHAEAGDGAFASTLSLTEVVE